MVRRASRSEQVTVAELLVRSAAAHDRYRLEDTLVLPRARHREKPQALRSLARVRVLSVVAGALALTGGVSAAVSMPVERSAGASWPPAGLEPPAIALAPVPADVVIPPAKPAPESVAPPAAPGGIAPVIPDSQPISGTGPAQRGKLAKAVKIIGKAKTPVQLRKPPKQAAPVRHEIPDFAGWWRSWAGDQDRRGHHHHHDGCGRHRR